MNDAEVYALGWAPVYYDEWCDMLLGQEGPGGSAPSCIVTHTRWPPRELLTLRELDLAVNREGLIRYTREKLFARLDRGI